MKRYRRGARRQGVVYGPPRQPGDGGDDSLVGRLLGPIVIIGAFGLLAAGAWAFVGRGGPPTASPTPTQVAQITPSPMPSPTLVATTPPLISPTPTATLPPSPSPTEFTIAVREGPGAITFGTEYDENTLRITDPRTTFPLRGPFYWSAQLTEAAGTNELRITVNRFDPSSDTETLVVEEAWPVENQNATIFLRRHGMARLVGETGIYVVRYFRGDILLAEGYFEAE